MTNLEKIQKFLDESRKQIQQAHDKALRALEAATNFINNHPYLDDKKLILEEIAANLVPTNWLHPLLTGPKAVVPSGYSFNPRDVEELLRRIKAAIREAGKK